MQTPMAAVVRFTCRPVLGPLTPQPGEHLGGVCVWWKDGVKGLDDYAGVDDQGETLVERHATHFEGWQLESAAQMQAGVAQEREGDVLALGKLLLFLWALGADADDARPEVSNSARLSR